MTVNVAGVQDAVDAIMAALEPLTNEIPGLQLYPGLNPNPTPPSIDIYPSDPFLTGAGMPSASVEVFFTIRARVSTADHAAGNRLLLRLLDPTDTASVQALVESSDAAAVTPAGVSGFREYVEDTVQNGRLLGCEWRVATFL